MDIQVDPTLLVVNLDNCINSDAAARQIVKGGGCMYTVAVTTNDDATMVQIPVSVHCAGDVQSAFGGLPQLQEHSNSQGHNQYSHLESEQYTQIPGDLQCLVSTNSQVESKEPSSNNPENQSEVIPEQQTSLDINTMYYNDIFNYLTNNTMPEGATASHKLLLKKRAKSYCVKDGILFYGHSKPKKVITDREEQLKILQDIHIEKETGIHLGVKKMYSAVNAACFWRGQYMDVANYVRQCNKCTEAGETRLSSLQEQYLEGKSSQNETTKGLLAEKTSGVWEKVEMAVYGPYSKTENENEFLVTLIDPVSQWIVAQPIPKENIPSHLISFVQHTFCLFGFAKCHVVKLSDDLKEVVQTLYKQQEASMQQFLSKFDLLSDTLLKDSIFVFSENNDECVWLNSLIKTFVNNHPTTWDSELMKFVFELNISKRGTAQTPFSKMFSRNPISFFSENKENAAVPFHNKENDVSVVSKRRRLQSSILQCRHCEEIFTSKISFRIHQRKHTEEARRRGILDGEDPIKIVSNRERRLLKRPMGLKHKRRLLKQQGIKKARILFASNKIQRRSTKLRRLRESKPVTYNEDNMKGACNSSTLLESTSQAVEVPLLATSLSTSQYLDESVNSSDSHREVLISIDTVSSDGSRDVPYDQLKAALPDLKSLSESNSNTDGDNFLSSSSVPVIFINDANISGDLFEDSSQLVINKRTVSLEKCATDSIVNEQDKCTSISSTVLSSLDVTPNHPDNYASYSSNIGENNLGSMEEDKHNVAPSDKFKVTNSCQISDQTVMNQMLSNIDSGAGIEDQFNSCGTVFSNHDALDSSNVELCISGPDTKLNDNLQTIKLIYSTTSMKEDPDMSSEMEQDIVPGGRKRRSKRDETFPCDYCDKHFDLKSRLSSHIKSEHSGMLLSCTKCSYTTKCKELLKHHQAIHAGTYKCNECHKLFTREIYLKYHIASFHGEMRLFTCAPCGAMFKSESGVKRHIQTTHEPPEEFPCDLCDYVGNCANSLYCHFERLHKKQFKCNDCDYESVTESALKKHVEIVHNIKERQFPCKLCSYRGAKRRHLLEHERNVHSSSINLHKCPICQKTFKTAVMLKHHLLCHTTRLLYSCKSCGHVSRHRQTLHYHIKRMHPGHEVKSLASGPSEEDFQEIIKSATQKSTPQEQTHEEEEDYTSVTSQMIPSSELMLSNVYLPDSFELQPLDSDVVDMNSKETVPGGCESVTSSSGLESSQMVNILDDPSLDNDKNYKIDSLSNVVSLGKHEMNHLVSFTKEEFDSVNNISFTDSDEFQPVQNYSSQHTEALLISSVVDSNEKESSQPLLNTFIGCDGGEPSEKNDEMLPLVNTSVIFQDDVTDTQDPLLHHESPLLDFISEQPMYEEEVSSWDQVTVYPLNS